MLDVYVIDAVTVETANTLAAVAAAAWKRVL